MKSGTPSPGGPGTGHAGNMTEWSVSWQSQVGVGSPRRETLSARSPEHPREQVYRALPTYATEIPP